MDKIKNYFMTFFEEKPQSFLKGGSLKLQKHWEVLNTYKYSKVLINNLLIMH